MPCWDGGSAQQPEDEREQQHAWEDPNDGDLPWESPRTARPGERWEPGWPEDDAGVEYRFYKRQQDEDDQC